MDDFKTILNELEPQLQSYVFARSKAKSKAEAFEESGLSKSKFYELPEEKQNQLEKLAAELKVNRHLMAEPKLVSAMEMAVDVLIEIAKDASNPANVRLAAVNSILDRTMGKATERVDVTSKGKSLKLYVGVSPDDWDD